MRRLDIVLEPTKKAVLEVSQKEILLRSSR